MWQWQWAGAQTLSPHEPQSPAPQHLQHEYGGGLGLKPAHRRSAPKVRCQLLAVQHEHDSQGQRQHQEHMPGGRDAGHDTGRDGETGGVQVMERE